MSKLLIFPILLTSFLSLNAYAVSCKLLLSGFEKTNSLLGLLAPLDIDSLVKNVDLGPSGSIETLNPRTDVVSYTAKDSNLLSDTGFGVDTLTVRDRIVETDFGYAVLDVDQLRDWTLLQYTIADPKRAQAFINQTANTPGFFPEGITKEAAEWLRWSVFAQHESMMRASKKLKDVHDARSAMSAYIDFDLAKRAEYRRLVKEKEIFMFPFAKYVTLEYNIMKDSDAQIVLAILARHFLISNLFVKRPDGNYRKLSEFLDRDSLMLVSRFPELLPAAPVFEGGHFSVDHMYTTVGNGDTYSISERFFTSREIEGQKFSNLFVASASGDSILGDETKLTLDGMFLVAFENEEKAFQELSSEVIEQAFSAEIEKMDDFLAIKTREFQEATGFDIPISKVVESDFSESVRRDYEINFGDNEVQPHILAAFYVFVGLRK